MKTDYLIRQAQKLTDIETELYWYLDTYKDLPAHPWEGYVNKVCIPLAITFPPIIKPETKKLLVAFTVLVNQYELVQGREVGIYSIMVSDECISSIENPEIHVIELFAELISRYYQAHLSKSMDAFKEHLDEAVLKWNYHPFVIEEKMHSVLKEGIESILDTYSLPKDTIPRALQNYQQRIDDKILENLKEFEGKVNFFISENTANKHQTAFIRFILEEINNGGKNLNSLEDVLPHYTNIQFN